jgi:hypothetical protein
LGRTWVKVILISLNFIFCNCGLSPKKARVEYDTKCASTVMVVEGKLVVENAK